MEQPPHQTWEWVESHLESPRIVSRFRHSHGYSNLWRIQARSDFFWLKMHAYPIKWAGEVHALLEWTPPLGLTPRVVAYKTDPYAVILTEMPGLEGESVSLNSEQEERMWSQAGDWLRRLHSKNNDWFGTISPDGTPSATVNHDPEKFVLATFEQRLREGADMELFSDEEVFFIRFGIDEWLPSLKGEIAHAIHRDFTPRNWLCQPHGELSAVIDFEHARWDVRAADMNRWWDWDFLRNPRLARAFFDAYGMPDDKLQTQIQTLRLCNAAGGVVWATKVKDYPFVETNRRALNRMLSEERTSFPKLIL